MGVLDLMGHVQKQSELGRERGQQTRLGMLAGQSYGATTEQRPQILSQMAQINPAMAQQQQTQFQGQDDRTASKAAAAAQYVLNAQKTGDPNAVRGAYMTVRPFLEEIGRAQGKVPPPEWSDDMLPMLHQVVSAGGGAGAGSEMKSVRIGEDGYYYAIQGGQLVNTGVRADARTQLRDQPGIDPGLVNLRTGAVTPIGANGAPPPATQPQTQFTGPDGMPINIGNDIPENVRAAIMADPSAFGSVPDGSTAQLPPTQAGGTGAAAARPAVSPAEQQRLQFAQEASQRAAEASQRANEAAQAAKRGNAPAGFRFKADGSLEPIPGGPKPAGATATEGERKAATLLARLTGSISQLETSVKEDPSAASPNLLATGVGAVLGGTAANALTPANRQRVEAAQLDILDAALTLGTGAAYTREQLEGYRKSYFPQIGDSQATIADKSARLTNVVEAAKIAAGRAQGGSNAPAAAAAPPAERRARNPQTGQVLVLRNGQWMAE